MQESLGVALSLLTNWDAQLAAIVYRSVLVSVWAASWACLLGAGLGGWLAMAQFRLKPVCVVLLQTLVAIPAVVVGLMAYLLLSRSGPLGGLGWLYSVKAMVFAQTVLVLPLASMLVMQLLDEGKRRLADRLGSMTDSHAWQAALLIADQWHAFLVIWVVCFGRAIAEVGTVMMVGGNIEGFTRVMTTAIALETSKGDLPLAMALGFILLTVVLCLNVMVQGINRLWRHTRTGHVLS